MVGNCRHRSATSFKEYLHFEDEDPGVTLKSASWKSSTTTHECQSRSLLLSKDDTLWTSSQLRRLSHTDNTTAHTAGGILRGNVAHQLKSYGISIQSLTSTWISYCSRSCCSFKAAVSSGFLTHFFPNPRMNAR